MADSFAADLMAGVLSVQEASPEGGFVIGLEYLLPVESLLVVVVCSMCKDLSTRRSSIRTQARQ